MLDNISVALGDYFATWHRMIDGTSLVAARPDAVGWKVADEAEYQKIYQELRAHCEIVVETWMNGRWIAKMHLKDQSLQQDIAIIKLMQRRPGSDDALGLDHVDFICDDMEAVAKELDQGTIKHSWETNDVVDDYRWLSVWFAGTEAKVKEYGVVDIVIKELQETKK